MSKNKSPLEIFVESIGLYFSNFDKFIKYMTFPVLGQMAGMVLILALTYFYAKNMPAIIDKIPALNNITLLVVISILIILPGLAIFLKAFWEYLVAYGAVNSMLENMLKSGKVYDFDAHTELIKRRAVPFIGIWFLFGVFSLISVIPFFWVPCAVLAVFFVLTFQVFTYESELTPINCVRKSLQLVKGHFASTFMLLSLVGALTYVLIPQIFNFLCEYTHITLWLSNIITPIINELPIDDWNNILSYLYLPALKIEELALFSVGVVIAQIVIQYTLPLRSILWGMWYKELNGGKIYISKEDKPKKKKSKKPSEKLMEASNKKYASKKIDRNLLKRALEKPDKE